MRRAQRTSIISIIAALAAMTGSMGYLSAKEPVKESAREAIKTANPSTVKLRGYIDEIDYAMRSAGITLESNQLPAFVGDVRAGSSAHYGGLSRGDKVMNAAISANSVRVDFIRGGKLYSLNLATTGSNKKQATAIDKDGQPAKLAQKALSESEKLKKIAQHDIVIVIDTSGSMGQKLLNSASTKWQWCQNFVSTFATTVSPLLNGRGITIVTFNDQYKILPQCNIDEVANVFNSIAPLGNTNLSAPVEAVFTRYFSGRRARPLQVVVLTDGVPSTGAKIEEVMVRESKRMRDPDEIRFTFLEIGDAGDGTELLTYLDNYLCAQGAPYDIVTSVGFERLKGQRLVDVLADPGVVKTTVPGSLHEEMEQLRQAIDNKRRKAENRD